MEGEKVYCTSGWVRGWGSWWGWVGGGGGLEGWVGERVGRRVEVGGGVGVGGGGSNVLYVIIGVFHIFAWFGLTSEMHILKI